MTTGSFSSLQEHVAELANEALRRRLPLGKDAERVLLRAEAIRRGLVPWRTFSEYLHDNNPHQTPYVFEHLPVLTAFADKVVTGEITRGLVLLPTRYLKTEIFGRHLPAYCLLKHPTWWTGLASYNASKAWEVSEEARTNYERAGGKLLRGVMAKRYWQTKGKGGLWAVGTEEGVIGRGFHLGIVDDPIDPEKALSVTFQKRFERWWPSKWLSRQEPHARILLVMQRLGMDDPVDFLFRREVGEGTEAAPEHWHVLAMDEVKSDEPLGRWNGPQGLPPTCTLVEDRRKPGQILAPSRFSASEVSALQRTIGSYTTATQRQQRPLRPTGDFWRQKWFRTYTELPSNAYNGGYDWDTAYTKDEHNSASAFVKSFRGPGEPQAFPIYIDEVGWDWLEFPELITWMMSFPGPHYVEEKASGKSSAQTLKVHGIVAEEIPVHGDKLARASSAQPVVSAGRVYVRQEVLHTLLLGEQQGLLRVTAESLQAERGALDVNDTFVQALHRHLGLGRGAVRKAKVLG